MRREQYTYTHRQTHTREKGAAKNGNILLEKICNLICSLQKPNALCGECNLRCTCVFGLSFNTLEYYLFNKFFSMNFLHWLNEFFSFLLLLLGKFELSSYLKLFLCYIYQLITLWLMLQNIYIIFYLIITYQIYISIFFHDF